jgi:hypothetical protein
MDIRIWRWLSARRRRKAVRETEQGVAELRQALAWLGVDRPVSRPVREKLRLFHGGRYETSGILRMSIVLFGVVWLGPSVRGIWRFGLEVAGIFTQPDGLTTHYVKLFHTYPIYMLGFAVFGFVIFATPVLVVLVGLMFGGPVVAAFVAFRGAYPADIADELPSGRMYRYRLVETVRSAVVVCAKAYGAGPGHEAAWLRRQVANELAGVEEAVRRAHRTRGTLPARSHRRRRLKEHAGRVAARLREAEAALDVNGDAALPELAEMLLTVAEQYADGHVGALLDEEDLGDISAVRDHEPLRLAAIVILTVAGAVAVSLLHLPSPAEGPAIAGVGVLAVTMVYGRNARQALSVLAPFGGGK